MSPSAVPQWTCVASAATGCAPFSAPAMICGWPKVVIPQPLLLEDPPLPESAWSSPVGAQQMVANATHTTSTPG